MKKAKRINRFVLISLASTMAFGAMLPAYATPAFAKDEVKIEEKVEANSGEDQQINMDDNGLREDGRYSNPDPSVSRIPDAQEMDTGRISNPDPEHDRLSDVNDLNKSFCEEDKRDDKDRNNPLYDNNEEENEGENQEGRPANANENEPEDVIEDDPNMDAVDKFFRGWDAREKQKADAAKKAKDEEDAKKKQKRKKKNKVKMSARLVVSLAM